jgi:hypothetical protein
MTAMERTAVLGEHLANVCSLRLHFLAFMICPNRSTQRSSIQQLAHDRCSSEVVYVMIGNL